VVVANPGIELVHGTTVLLILEYSFVVEFASGSHDSLRLCQLAMSSAASVSAGPGCIKND